MSNKSILWALVGLLGLAFLAPSTSLAQNKTASLVFEVADYDRAHAQIDSLLRRWGASLASEKEDFFVAKTANQCVVRVPNENFDGFLADVSSLAKSISSRESRLLDLAKEKQDLQLALDDKNRALEQHRQILSRAKAALEIESAEAKIAEVAAQLAVLQGQMLALEQGHLSSIQLDYHQKKGAAAPAAGEQPAQAAAHGLLWNLLVYSLPVAVLAGLMFALYRVQRNKKRRTRKQHASTQRSNNPW